MRRSPGYLTVEPSQLNWSTRVTEINLNQPFGDLGRMSGSSAIRACVQTLQWAEPAFEDVNFWRLIAINYPLHETELMKECFNQDGLRILAASPTF
ncbi:hypothetical protein RUE5091_03321 [Ruegeria denitrificans]|uniref:Uncharacterized protein n=1 Tax=Ruegeria denitrificans TaxID=1715692 RepID=A0A0P1INP5_9RHOB|nr:hypothetical protein RUE5091_03321 [Ruegeria denitrificans]